MKNEIFGSISLAFQTEPVESYIFWIITTNGDPSIMQGACVLSSNKRVPQGYSGVTNRPNPSNRLQSSPTIDPEKRMFLPFRGPTTRTRVQTLTKLYVRVVAYCTHGKTASHDPAYTNGIAVLRLLASAANTHSTVMSHDNH